MRERVGAEMIASAIRGRGIFHAAFEAEVGLRCRRLCRIELVAGGAGAVFEERFTFGLAGARRSGRL